MIRRRIQELLRRRLLDYPAVALVGPRQCWKTPPNWGHVPEKSQLWPTRWLACTSIWNRNQSVCASIWNGNASQIGQSLGLSYHTVNSYLDYLVGASWEGFVVEQAIGVLDCVGRPFEAFYVRTSDQHEIDLVLDLGGDLWALEVKLTTSPAPVDMDRLDKAADLIGASRRYLVSKTKRTTGDVKRASRNLPWLLKRLDD